MNFASDSAQEAIGLGHLRATALDAVARPLTITAATKMELDKARAEVARLEQLVSLLEANPEIENILTLLRRY